MPELSVLAAAEQFACQATELDRELRRAGITIPAFEAKSQLARSFWSLVRRMDACDALGKSSEWLKTRCREIAGQWLFRSRYWNRAYHKPHGYAGDFQMIEWLYDLEGDPCEDPTQPAIVNCLDYLMSTVHSTRALWHRRRWFSDLIGREYERCGRRLRILDVAAGGARYIRDFLSTQPDASEVQVTLADQDPAAMAFCRMHSLARWSPQVTTHSIPIRALASRLPGGQFDLILAAGLLDYLNDDQATTLITYLTTLVAAEGVIAFSVFHPSDRSRLVKDWLVDWPLVFRDEPACAKLLPTSLRVRTERSEHGTLSYAAGRVRSG